MYFFVIFTKFIGKNEKSIFINKYNCYCKITNKNIIPKSSTSEDTEDESKKNSFYIF